MKIFYYGYDRCDTALVASYIHLNKLSLDRIPTIKEVSNAFHSLNIEPNITGVPWYLGYDENHNEIYVVGFGNQTKLALQAIANLHPQEDWKFYSTIHEKNAFIGLGSFFLSRLKLVEPGIQLIALGAQRSYLGLAKLVKTVKGLNRVG